MYITVINCLNCLINYHNNYIIIPCNYNLCIFFFFFLLRCFFPRFPPGGEPPSVEGFWCSNVGPADVWSAVSSVLIHSLNVWLQTTATTCMRVYYKYYEVSLPSPDWICLDDTVATALQPAVHRHRRLSQKLNVLNQWANYNIDLRLDQNICTWDCFF